MQYKSYLTEVGESKVAAAVQSGVKLDIVSVGVGDGGGNTVEPAPVMTELVNEVARLGISEYSIDYNAKTIEVEAIIPPETGGFIIRELGVFDAEGDLIAVSNYPATEKPVVSSGVVTDVAVGMVFVVSAVTAVNIIVGENSTMVGLTHTARVATTESLILSGLQTVDGVSVNVGDRVLVKNQTAGAENGIYIVLESEWTRALDYDSVEDIVPGSLVSVVEGTVNGGYLFQLNTPAPITIGSTALSFGTFLRAEDKAVDSAKLNGKQGGENDGDVFIQGTRYTRTGPHSYNYMPADIVVSTNNQSGVWGVKSGPLTSGAGVFAEIKGEYYNGSQYVPFFIHCGCVIGSGDVFYGTQILMSETLPVEIYKTAENGLFICFIFSSVFRNIKCALSTMYSGNKPSWATDTSLADKTLVSSTKHIIVRKNDIASTDLIPEGSGNLYFTAARSLAAVAEALAAKANASHDHSASDITSGTLSTGRGGTGKSSYASNRYLRTTSTSVIGEYTPAQVLTDIGAAAAAHSHSLSNITDADFTALKSANGYQKLPSGLIIQWGTVTTAAAPTPVNFPIAFPNACLSVTASASSESTVGSEVFQYQNVNASSFGAHAISFVSGSWNYYAIQIKWVAIGY